MKNLGQGFTVLFSYPAPRFMLNLHRVPSKEIISEWVHVRFALGTWDRLLLIECENSTIYFFRGWDHDLQFTLPHSKISEIVDSEVIHPRRKGMECRIELKTHRQEQPFMNRFFQALKVRYSIPSILIFTRHLFFRKFSLQVAEPSHLSLVANITP